MAIHIIRATWKSIRDLTPKKKITNIEIAFESKILFKAYKRLFAN